MTASLSPATQDLCPSIVMFSPQPGPPACRLVHSTPSPIKSGIVTDTAVDTVDDWQWGMSGFG